jgi:hypothetical protein
LTGALPAGGTTAVAAELAELDPDGFVPVTAMTSVEPTSPVATVYDDVVAPSIATQFRPFGSQSCH